MRKDRITLHIGLPKTGTTFLQNAFFPTLQGVSFFHGYEPYRSFLDAGHEHLLVSDESLGGHPFRPDFQRQFEHRLRKLAAWHREISVIFGVRAHTEYVLSLYRQYLQEGGCMNQRDFLQLFTKSDLLLMPKIRALQSVSSSVFVYRQEDLRTHSETVLREMASFLETDFPGVPPIRTENEGVKTKIQTRCLLALNRISSALPFSLYHRVFRYARATPRHLCQNYLRRLGGKSMPSCQPDLAHCAEELGQDWKAVRKQLGYEIEQFEQPVGLKDGHGPSD